MLPVNVVLSVVKVIHWQLQLKQNICPVAIQGWPVCLLPDGGNVQNMWYSSLWVTLACAAVGTSDSHGEERLYNLKRAEVEMSVKNNEKCPMSVLFMLYSCIHALF